MADSQSKLREVSWNELFPWLILMRSVRIALLARVLILSAVGLMATTIGWQAIGWVFSGSEAADVQAWRGDLSRWVWEHSSAFTIDMTANDADDIFTSAIDKLPQAPLDIWLYFTKPFRGLFSEVSPSAFLFLLLCAAWELLVWGWIGGAITRIAALRFTRGEAPGPVAALKHAAEKLPSYSLPPLVALGGSAIFAGQLLLLGLLMRWSVIAFLAGLAWPFVLLLGLMMAILLLGALVGWPFMWATISVEGTDAFDALSRSYAYTYHRPWRLLWYILFAAVLAAVSMFAVKMFAMTAIALGDWSIDWGVDDITMETVVRPKDVAAEGALDLPAVVPLDAPALEPPITGEATSSPQESSEGDHELGRLSQGARSAIAFWKSMMVALAAGYQAGFLWVSAVGVYLLLRRDIDGVQMTEVYLDEDEEFGLPPLAEDSATGVPEISTSEPARPGDATLPGDLPRTD